MNNETDNDWITAAELLVKGQNVKYCSAPETIQHECTKKIIGAHTLSKSLSLKPISVNGRVMAVNKNPFTLDKNNGRLTFEDIGISKASIFTGFCSHHDKSIFSPIEDKVFIPTKETLFLQAYRISCMEKFRKKINVKSQEKMKIIHLDTLKKIQNESPEKINEEDAKFFIEMIDNIHSQEKIGLEDMTNQNNKMEHILLESEFSRLEHFVIEIKDVKISVGSTILLEIDLNNKTLQDLNETGPKESIIFNCICTHENQGFIIFSWFQESSLAKKFIESLQTKKDLEDILVEFFYSYSENIYSNPTWWDTLPERTRSILEHKANELSVVSRDFKERKAEYNAFKITQKFFI